MSVSQSTSVAPILREHVTLEVGDSVIDVCGCILTHKHPVPPANQARFVGAAKPSNTYLESIGTSHLKT